MRILDDLEYINNENEDICSPSNKVKAARRKRCISHTERTTEIKSCRPGAGKGHTRRYENLAFLLNMTDQDADVDTTEELSSILEPSISSLGQLFLDQHKMKVWNDFINRSEEDQAEYLKECNRRVRRQSLESDTDSDIDDLWEDLTDNRAVHPAFSAKESFMRIESGIRKVLNGKHIGMVMLTKIEADVLMFFCTWPDSVYISQLENNYDRMLLRALCQYLDLHLFSYDGDDGTRLTQVESLTREFIRPPITLTEYLHSCGSH